MMENENERFMTEDQLSELIRNTAKEAMSDVQAKIDEIDAAMENMKAEMAKGQGVASSPDVRKLLAGWGTGESTGLNAFHRWCMGKSDPSRKLQLSTEENALLLRSFVPRGADKIPISLGGPANMQAKDFADIRDYIIGSSNVAWLPTQIVEDAVKDTTTPHTRYVRANARIHNMSADVHVIPLIYNPDSYHWSLADEGAEPDIFTANTRKEELRWSKKVHIEALYDLAQIRSPVDLAAWIQEQCLSSMLNAEEYAAWRSTAAFNDQFMGIAPMVAPDAIATTGDIWVDLLNMKKQVGPYNAGASYFCGDALWYNLLQAFSKIGYVGPSPLVDIQGALAANAFTVQGLGTFYRHSLLDVVGGAKDPDPGQTWKGWLFYGNLAHYHIGQVGHSRIPLFGLQILGPGSSYMTFRYEFSLYKVAVLNGGLLNYGKGETQGGKEIGCPRITWSALDLSAQVDTPIKICIPTKACEE